MIIDIRDYAHTLDAVYNPVLHRWEGTDNAPAFKQAILEAAPGDVLYAPNARWLSTAFGDWEKMLTLRGDGAFATQITAHPDCVPGVPLVNLSRPGSHLGTRSALSNHGHGFDLDRIGLDGNGRTVDVPGLYLDKLQHCEFNRVEIRHFAQQGILAPSSIRECWFNDVQVKYCGDESRGMADWDMMHTTSVDGHNNLWLQNCQVTKGYGGGMLIGSSVGNRPTRTVMIKGGLFHGARDLETASSTGYGDYHASPTRSNTQIVIRNARGVRIEGARIHDARNDSPLVRIEDHPGVAPTRNDVSISGCEFGAVETGPLVQVTAPLTSLRLDGNNLTDTGASAVLDLASGVDLVEYGNDWGGVPLTV